MAGESNTDKFSTQTTEARNKPSPPSTDTARPDTEEQNPFIAFRRYADEQISSMLQSVMGIPSMMAPPHSVRWPRFDAETQQRLRRNEPAEQNDHEDSTDRWTRGHWGSGHDGDFFGSWGFSHHPFNSFESFFDERSPFGFGGFFSPESTFFGGDSQTWPIPYLLLSPYSPLHLERSHGRNRDHQGILSSFFSPHEATELGLSQPRWRDAFEDLLRVENGLALLDQSTESDRSKQSANEWLRGLVQRGSIGSNWRLTGPDDSRYGLALERSQQYNGINENLRIEPQDDAEPGNKTEKTEPETELDLYDRFLNDIATAHEKYSRAFADSPLMRLLEEERKRHLEHQDVAPKGHTEKTESKDWLEYTANGNRELLDSQYMSNRHSAEPNVVSTMTRTVRRTQPDGSISTKTIQTRRFADGREESNESEEVIPPSTQKNVKQKGTSDEEKGGSNSTGGWFWTR